MRRPGQGDTLVKIASLGGGAAGVGGILSKDAERHKKIKEEMAKAEAEDSAYQAKIAGMKAKQEHEKEMRKKVAKKKMDKSKCPKCSGKGCSHCKGDGYHEK